MSAIEFRNRYFNALLDLVWRQWINLGVSGQMATSNFRYVYDPEMLLIFSAWFCRYEPRLYDLIIDWLRNNGAFINISRLKSLMKKVPWVDPASLGFMFRCAGESGDRRWKKLADELIPSESVSQQTLFLTIDGEANDFLKNKDENALQYGYLRSPYLASKKTTLFSSTAKGAFLLQLRGAFGLSARAEAILALLNKDVCKIQDIADISCFSWKSIQDVMAELCASSLVASQGGEKRGRYYFIKDPQAFLAVWGKENADFPDWKSVFNALAVVWQTVSNPKLAKLSEATFHSEIKRAFEDQIADSLLNAGISSLKFFSPKDISALPEIIAEIA